MTSAYFDDEDVAQKIKPRFVPTVEEYFIGQLMLQSVLCRTPTYQRACILSDSKDRLVSSGIDMVLKSDFQSKGYGWDERTMDLALHCAEEIAIDAALRKITFNGIYDSLSTSILYVNCHPIVRGVRRCIANEVKTIVYLDRLPEIYEINEDDWKQTKELSKAYGITLKTFQGSLGWIRDRLEIFKEII